MGNSIQSIIQQQFGKTLSSGYQKTHDQAYPQLAVPLLHFIYDVENSLY